MQAELYSFTVSVMRYFFVAAIIYILFRIVYHSFNEYGELRRVKNWIENGFAKHIEFLPPYDNNEEGFILVRSNLIGRSPRCDICIDDKSVKRRHALMFEKHDALYLKRRGRAKVEVNGEVPNDRITELHDGDLVQLGDVQFYYRLKRVPFNESTEAEDE